MESILKIRLKNHLSSQSSDPLPSYTPWKILKLAFSPLKIGRAPTGNDRLPTIWLRWPYWRWIPFTMGRVFWSKTINSIFQNELSTKIIRAVWSLPLKKNTLSGQPETTMVCQKKSNNKFNETTDHDETTSTLGTCFKTSACESSIVFGKPILGEIYGPSGHFLVRNVVMKILLVVFEEITH